MNTDPGEIVIRRHPDVEDYFDLRGSAFDRCDLRGPYEAGKLIFFKAAPLDLDWRFLASVPVITAPTMAVRKAKPAAVLAPVEKATYAKHVLSHFWPKDYDAAREYQRQVLKGTEQLTAFFRRAFPGYELDALNYTWRCTLTAEPEPLHYDSYDGQDNEKHNVRLFVNIDDRPRKWRVSHPVTKAIADFPGPLPAPPGVDPATLHPNNLNAWLNLEPWVRNLPCHEVEFPPRSAWLVNSQLVAHEIVWGRRMLGYTFRVFPESMGAPDKGFAPAARRAVAARLARDGGTAA